VSTSGSEPGSPAPSKGKSWSTELYGTQQLLYMTHTVPTSMVQLPLWDTTMNV